MDHNTIQAPDLIRRLTSRLGMRQAHITPTLAEHVQPVVVLDDMRVQREVGGKQAFCLNTIVGGNALTLVGYFVLQNPTGSGVNVRLRRISLEISAVNPGVLQIAVDVVHPLAVLVATQLRTDSLARDGSKCKAFAQTGTVPNSNNLANLLYQSGSNPTSFERTWPDYGPFFGPGKVLEILPNNVDTNTTCMIGIEWQEEAEAIGLT